MSSGQFCFWDAKSDEDAYIIIVKQIITLIILSYCLLKLNQIYYFYVRNKQNIQNGIKNIIKIYCIILMWATMSLFQHGYSIFIYFSYIKNTQQQSQQMIQYSRFYSIIDRFPGFLIQTLFISICIIYCKNIYGLIPVQEFAKYQISYRKFLQLYFLIRIFIIVCALLGILFSEDGDLSLFSNMSIGFIIFDAFTISILLFCSFKWYIKKLDAKDISSSIKNQYILMMTTSCFRVLIDIIFLLFVNNNADGCIYAFPQHLGFSIGYGVFGQIFNHFVPIIVILAMYNYNSKNHQHQEHQSDGSLLNQ